MKILAFDLVWDGMTGWVLWNGNLKDPIIRYGEFQPKVKGKLTGALRQQAMCKSLYGLCHDRAYSLTIFDTEEILVAFEQSDWFQDIGRAANWKTAYARERTVQRSLGMAEAAFMLAMDELELPIYGIGAREAKQEFGAIRKDSAARLLCDEYPRFTIIEVKEKEVSENFMFGSKTDGFFVVSDKLSENNSFVPHHVTDAIVIAKVVDNRRRMEGLA